MPNRRATNSLSLVHSLAGMMALVFLWMGTGAVLHHTDDLSFTTSLSHRQALGHATSAASQAPCTACEWIQGLLAQTPSLPATRPAQPSHTAYAERCSAYIPNAPVGVKSTRGPPALF